MIIAPAPRAVTLPRSGSRVGIVMAAYNVEAYIEAAMRSVIAQTYSDWELVVVDDGSTDDTANVAARVQMEKSTLIRRPHEAQGGARARGYGSISPACEWLLFLDADDVLLPGALETMLREAKGRRVSAVSGYSRLIDKDGHDCSWDGNRSDGSNFLGITEARYLGPEDIRAGAKIFPPATILIKRSYYVACGGFLPDMPSYEDEDLIARLSLLAPIWASGRLVCLYRRRGGQLTANNPVMRAGEDIMQRRWSLYEEVYTNVTN